MSLRFILMPFLAMIFFRSAAIGQSGSAVAWHDPSSHTAQMLTVDGDVQLEVLDWGGTGRPLIFLAGMGNTAHIWDDFAPKFTAHHHVYAITRRGFGRSSHPATGYKAERLADDILAVMTALKIEKPVLVGHSLGGEELSSIGTRHPERVSGLVYLDAAYTYAFYDAAGDYDVSLKDIEQKLDALAKSPKDTALMDQVRAALPQFESNLNRKANSAENPLPARGSPPSAEDKASYAAMRRKFADALGGVPPESELHESFLPRADGGVGEVNMAPEAGKAIYAGFEHFTAPIPVPILAVMGYPQSKGANFRADSPKNIAAAAAADADQARQIDAFEKAQPTAQVVRIAGANHYIFISNERQVISAMNQFIGTLH